MMFWRNGLVGEQVGGLERMVTTYHSAAAIVLDDFVISVVSTATNDPGLVARIVVFDRDSVLANTGHKRQLHSSQKVKDDKTHFSNHTFSSVQGPVQ